MHCRLIFKQNISTNFDCCYEQSSGGVSASEMTYIVSGGALNYSLTPPQPGVRNCKAGRTRKIEVGSLRSVSNIRYNEHVKCKARNRLDLKVTCICQQCKGWWTTSKNSVRTENAIAMFRT